MAGLCWMAVTLVWFLSAGNSLAAVDQNNLATIVNHFLRRYTMRPIKINNHEYIIEGQVSFAVNIPVDQDVNNLEKVFEKDPPDTVIEKVSKDNEVYQGTNVVAAKFKKFEKYTDHAEARVLDKIKPLADRSRGHFLVFYTYLSPCGTKCTNKKHRHNIFNKINNINSEWKDIVLVFSKVYSQNYDGTTIQRADIAKTLEQLAETKIGQNNIFRCYRPQNIPFQCIKCYNQGKLSEECVNNEA